MELPPELRQLNQAFEFERSRVNSSNRKSVDFYRRKDDTAAGGSKPTSMSLKRMQKINHDSSKCVEYGFVQE